MRRTRMISDIIEVFLAMPKIALGGASQTEFFQISNDIISNKLPLNRKSFDDMIKLKNPAHITWREKVYSIYPYLDWWEKMCSHLTLFLKLIHLSWKSTYHKEFTQDDILSFLIMLIKKFCEDKLEQLDNNLQYMKSIDGSIGEIFYYLNSFNAATQFLLMQEQNPIADDHNDGEEKKIFYFLEVISGKDYYSQLYLVHSILNICSTRSSSLLDALISDIEKHHLSDFRFSPKDIGAEQTVIDMHAKLEFPPLSQHPDLCSNIKKYAVYFEFRNALTRQHANMFERLREFVYKYETLREDLGDDLKTMMFEILEPTINYLEIPPQHDSWFGFSIFNFASHHNNLRLDVFFASVLAKISRLDNCNDADKVNCGF